MVLGQHRKTSVHTRNETIGVEKVDVRYSFDSIYILEKLFGVGWLSPGGEELAREFFLEFKLRPGQKVLDIGSGAGGAATLLAWQFGVYVQGIDYSKQAVDVANQRLNKEEKLRSKIDFKHGDIREIEFAKNSFDAIYCRDVLVHIREKESVLKKIKDWLKPGGKLLVTDYCRGEAEPTKEFISYTQDFSFDLITVEEYGKMIEDIGFELLETRDISDKFLEANKKELKFFLITEEYTVQEFGQEAYDEIVSRWNTKIRQTASKLQGWGYFFATK